jgi:ligand-binding sensor domain-containing protein/tRNA A-37 threonylcarbamoyl transferase component Bud32
VQTGDGYLWLGTEEGLVRFDGIKFKEFNDIDTPEIKNNYIVSLFEDKKGNLWIGSRGGGLVMYKNGEFKRYWEKNGLSNLFINTISEDEENNLWIGTDRGGIYKFKNNKFTSYTGKDGLPSNIIKYICPGSNGVLWIATINGLSCIKHNRILNFSIKDGLPAIHINTVHEDNNKKLWVGTEKGLYKYMQGKFLECKIKPGSPSFNIKVIFEDRDGNIWIGTAANGLIRCDKKGEFSFLTKKEGLSDNTIRSITEDREGNLWVGTALGGVNCLRDEKFTTFGTKEGLCDDVVFSIYEDRRNNLWIGTNSGLNRFDNGKCFHFSTKDGLSNNVIASITGSSGRFIWVCTDNGLNRLLLAESKTLQLNTYLRDKYLLAVLEDKAGNLWAGTLGGLFKKSIIKEQKNRGDFIQQQGLPSKVINFIYEDSRGYLWVSALRKGLARYKDGTFTLFNTKNGLISNNVNCIYEDKDAVLWIGTIDGLSRFKDDKFVNYTRKNGLFNNNIYQILEDGSQNLWMSCNNGVFQVAKGDLINFAENKAARIVSTAYGKNDGMKSSECNGGYQGAGCKTKDGKMWFPTMKGVVCIDPENISINKVPPRVLIEQVILDGIPVDHRKNITIHPGTKRIEFSYTAPTFIVPEKVKFKYKLSGYDDDWVNAGTQRTALYTNLDAGEFRFKIIACNSDGIWNKDGASIYIEVIPPFWKSWWFILLSLTSFAAVSYLVINFFRKYITLAKFWKKNKLIGQFKLLEKIGAGGMGTIYKAKSITNKSGIVAVKVLKEDLFAEEKNRKRFKQEAAIIDRLEHPNIVKVFERGESKQNSFIAMELLEGQTLARKIFESDERKVDLHESVAIMIQVSDALKKMHGKNIVHRDLKPENIMLINKDGNPNFVKILDFGLAMDEYHSRLTRTGAIIGTINYISPEQIGRSEFSSASDIYSAGIIFYEMITGVDPFQGETTIDIMKQIIYETPIEANYFRPGIPAELNDLIMAMLNKDKNLRPSAEDMLETLPVLLQSGVLVEEAQLAAFQ